MSNEEELDRMDTADMEYSIASQIAYTYYDNNNDAEATQKILDTYINGYTFDPEYSNNNASTIIRPDGTAILAYRGTRPTNLDDLNVDASILAGQHKTDIPHPRFVEALNHYNFVKQKYNNVDLTGHSLGGTLADYVGRMNDEKTVVFNPGESPFSVSVINASNTTKTRVYRTKTFDVISFANSLYPHANKIRVVPQTEGTGVFDSWLNSHSLNNFLPSIDMLPLSKEQDIIIPSRIPVATQKQEIIKQEQYISDVCKSQPYLFYCKERPKLKKYKKKLI